MFPLFSAVQEEMRERGWLARSGGLTAAGTAEHAEIERLTDAAAGPTGTLEGEGRPSGGAASD
jgi:Helix-turn-helix family